MEMSGRKLSFSDFKYRRHKSDFFVTYSTARDISSENRPPSLINTCAQLDGTDEKCIKALKPVRSVFREASKSYNHSIIDYDFPPHGLPSPPPSPSPPIEALDLRPQDVQEISVSPQELPETIAPAIETPDPSTAPDLDSDSFPFPKVDEHDQFLRPLKLRSTKCPTDPYRRTADFHSGSSTPSSRKADRFILPRTPGTMRDNFELRTSPASLSPLERIARHRAAALNPFVRRPRSVSHTHVDERLSVQRNRLSHRFHIAPSTIRLRHGSPTADTRQISAGAV